MRTECEMLCCKRRFFRIVARLCEKLSWHVLNLASFEFLPKNDETEYPPVPFDITPFSLTPTMTTRPHKQDWVPSSFRKAERIHLRILLSRMDL